MKKPEANIETRLTTDYRRAAIALLSARPAGLAAAEKHINAINRQGVKQFGADEWVAITRRIAHELSQ